MIDSDTDVKNNEPGSSTIEREIEREKERERGKRERRKQEEVGEV